jgi:hypothetical protein
MEKRPDGIEDYAKKQGWELDYDHRIKRFASWILHLEARLEDYQSSTEQALMNHDDQVHCTCVPLLCDYIKKLERVVEAALEELNEVVDIVKGRQEGGVM